MECKCAGAPFLSSGSWLVTLSLCSWLWNFCFCWAGVVLFSGGGHKPYVPCLANDLHGDVFGVFGVGVEFVHRFYIDAIAVDICIYMKTSLV